MEEHVRLQLVVVHEAPPTDFARAGLFARVKTHVSPEVVLKREAHATHLACKGLASVHGLVRSERAPPGESLPARRAHVRLLIGVNAMVALQGGSVPKGLAAWLLRGVHRLVSVQVVFGFEGLLADVADERSRVGVHQLMPLQARSALEGLAAELTGEAGLDLLLVSQQMVLEGHRGPECSGALVAGERPQLSVGVRVLRHKQLPVAAEHCFLCPVWTATILHSCRTQTNCFRTSTPNLETHSKENRLFNMALWPFSYDGGKI